MISKPTTKRICTLFFLILLFSAPAFATNDFHLIGGFGLGTQEFDEKSLNSRGNILYGSKFIDWFPFDKIGFGLRDHVLIQTETKNESFTVIALNFTLNWTFLEISNNIKSGIYGGFGPGVLTYSNKDEQLDFSENTNTSSTGIYLDWLGEKWGVRLKYHSLNTSFTYQNGQTTKTINESGQGLDLGFTRRF